MTSRPLEPLNGDDNYDFPPAFVVRGFERPENQETYREARIRIAEAEARLRRKYGRCLRPHKPRE